MPSRTPPLEIAHLPVGRRFADEWRLQRWEAALAVAVFLVLVFLKIRYVTALTVNPDEPQHLHVTWAWSRGAVQYRDLFDNHTPLFQMLFSPLAGWLGERADILYPMRLAMLPLSAAVLASVAWIGARLYSLRAGVWAALLCGLSPFYLLISTEYRTDNFWAFCWMLALVCLFTGELTKGRSFLAGLLVGASFCTSMKTSLLFISLAAAALVVIGCRIAGGREPGLFRRTAVNTAVGFLGFLVIPALLTLYFGMQGALDALFYCVFEHNLVPGLKRYSFDRWSFPIRFPLLLGSAWLVYRFAPSPEVASRRAILWLGSGLALLLLMCYWPMVTRQDFAAIAPFLAVPLGAGLMALSRSLYLWWISRFRGAAAVVGLLLALLIPAGVAAYEVRGSLEVWGIDDDSLDSFNHGLETRLRLAPEGEPVMDAKGETIFRWRPFYYVLEGVTLHRLKHGLTRDTIEEDCRRTNTRVIMMGRIPKEQLSWVRKAYIQATSGIWVAGRKLPAGPGPRRFELQRSAPYYFVTPGGKTRGMVDGVPVGEEPVLLEPGVHEFDSDETGPVAAVWAHALDAGFNPFDVKPKAKRSGPKKKIPTNPFSKKKKKHRQHDDAQDDEA